MEKNTKSKAKKSLDFSKEQYIKWYKDMLVMRKVEERVGHLYIQQKFGGFCHLYIGQEAIVAGTVSACEKGDKHITAYRDHAHPIGLGVHPKYMLAELYGKKTGMSKGKGGSMHMFSKEKNFYGGHGIVGAQVPIGVGLAFSHKYKNDGFVCMTYLGDGAVNQGQVYESFNMSALWNLPVIFIIENNKYGMGTSVDRASAGSSLADRGKAYGIPGMEVDGMNIFSVREAGKEALDFTRSGKGPFILEMKTYRYRGHSMSDPAKYRTRSEVDAVRQQKDCIENLKEVLQEQKVTDQELKNIDGEIKSLVTKASDFALESKLPDDNELLTDIYL
jgi:pyruvate dehydrogenase E1 component alpha subunit